MDCMDADAINAHIKAMIATNRDRDPLQLENLYNTWQRCKNVSCAGQDDRSIRDARDQTMLAYNDLMSSIAEMKKLMEKKNTK